MNTNPKISIILPTYNCQDFIADCLNSLINDPLQDIEIIIVDDASTDNTKKLIKLFMEKDERIKLFENLINLGVSAARNLGLLKTTGHYTFLMDPDDFLVKDSLIKMYEKIVKDNSEILLLNAYKYFSKNRIIPFNNPYYGSDHRKFIGSCAWFCLFNSNFLKKYPKIIFTVNAHPHEDVAFTFKAFSYASSTSRLNDPILYYRQHSNQKTFNSNENRKKSSLLSSTILVMDDLKEFVNNENLCSARKIIYHQQIILMISYLKISLFHLKNKNFLNFYFQKVIPVKVKTFIYRKKFTRNGYLIIKILKIPIFHKKI